MPRIKGFIKAILGRDQTHQAEAFVVEIYIPTERLGQRTKRYQLEEVCDSREFVIVSILRDALSNGLIVDIGIDNQNRIHDVEVQTRNSYFQADPGQVESIQGRIAFISLGTLGMKEGAQWQGAIAKLHIQPDQGVGMDLFLDLQSPDRDVKLVQLDILRRSHQDSIKVNISFEIVGTPEGSRRWIREVVIGTVESIRPIPVWKPGQPPFTPSPGP
jgi:hypothetical protein